MYLTVTVGIRKPDKSGIRMVDLALNRVFENRTNLSGFLMLWPPFCPVLECHSKTERISLVFEWLKNRTVRFSDPHCNVQLAH
jgi:hypothetical protein